MRLICVFFILLLCSNPAFTQKRTLDFYVEQATSNSPLLLDYHNQVASNLIERERVRSTYLPQVTGTSSNSYAPVIKGYGYDEAVTNGANLSALVGVNKTIIGKKNLQSQFETLQITNRSIQNSAQISEQEIKRAIASQYVTTYGDLQQLHFTRDIYNLLAREDTVLRRLTESNVYHQTDYLTFLVTLQQQGLSVKQQTIQLQNDFATLNYLCGIVDTGIAELEEPRLSPSALPSPEHSIFFYQYTLDSLKLRNDRSILDFSYKPKVNLFADAGYNSSLLSIPYKNFGASFGFSMAVPIYDGHQRKMQYRKLDLAEQTRKHYEDFFAKQYRQQIAQLMQQLKSTQDMIDQINKQIKYSEGLIQADTKLLITGDVRIADLVIAINNYLTARNLLTQNTIGRLQIITQINYWNR